MSDSSKTQITIAVIGLVGVVATSLFANWDKIFPPDRSFTQDVADETPAPSTEVATVNNRIVKEFTTTCFYSAGPKAGQTQHFPIGTPGLTAGVVGYPCQDGQGSFGVGVPDAE